jgi:hypothetical protein
MGNSNFDVAYQALVKHCGKICSHYQRTDSELERLVNEGIISQEERYLVFSYPLPTVLNCLHRWAKLIEILRNRRGFLPLFHYWRAVWIPGFTEVFDCLLYEFTQYKELRKFAVGLI